MIDTVILRFHGLNDVKNDLQAQLMRENGGGDSYAVPEHNELFKKLLNFKGKNFSIVKSYNRETNSEETLTQSDFLHLELSNQKSQHYLNMDVIRFEDAKQVKEIYKSLNGSYRVASSHNAVSFFVNPSGSYVDFNVSIPKYLYGHNFAQFVPQHSSNKYFHHPELKTWNGQVKHLYPRLIAFINKFLEDLCIYFELDLIPSLEYIELRRIDLCYNQHFKSKDEAMEVLKQQQKLNFVKQTKKALVSKEYQTSFEHKKANGAYFKVYHKGTEYSESQHGDRKKHLELNQMFLDKYFRKKFIDVDTEGNEKTPFDRHVEVYTSNRELFLTYLDQRARGQAVNIDDKKYKEIEKTLKHVYKKLPYKVGFLKSEMDKVLRYEVSLRSDFFRYAFKNKIFRKECIYHQKAKETYKFVKSAYDKRNSDKVKISKNENKIYKMFNKWFTRKVFFTFTDNTLLARFNKSGRVDYNMIKDEYIITNFGYRHTILRGKDVAKFDAEFLKICCQYFKTLVDNFQLQELQKYDDVQSRIRKYNDDAKRNVEIYNEENKFKLIDKFGNRKRRKITIWDSERQREVKAPLGTEYTKAVQLLTQTEKRNYKRNNKPFHLMGVDEAKLLFIVDLMINKGKSQRQIAKEMGLPPRKFQRYRQLLEVFDIYENTLEMSQPIEMKTDFTEYYWLTSGDKYSKKFFTKESHSKSL